MADGSGLAQGAWPTPVSFSPIRLNRVRARSVLLSTTATGYQPATHPSRTQEGGIYDSWLPIHAAAFKGHLDIVQMLVAHGY